MPAYSLIAFDMDGTLLNSKKQIDPDTLAAIREASLAGKTVVLATGRAVGELQAFRALLYPMVRYAVLCSGAGLYDWASEEYLSCSTLTDAAVRALFRAARGADAMVHLLFRGGTAVQKDALERMDYFNMGVYREQTRRIADTPEDLEAYCLQRLPQVLKLNFYCHSPAERERILSALPLEGITAIPVEETIVECSPVGVNKGTGLLALCERLGIPRVETIAVGDSGNDLDMLRTAGLGIAMGNASPEARAAAALTVADCDHGGCAEAIRRCLLAPSP